MRPVVLKLRGLRWPLFIICILCHLITVVMPTVMIFLIGGLKTYGLPFIPKNMTFDNYAEIFRMKLTRSAIRNSVYLSTLTAFVTMLSGVMIGCCIVKMKVKGKFILEFLGVLPYSLPGTVIALGCILTWSGKFGINLYNTAGIIFVAYIARYMAFSIKSNSAALEQVSDSLEEASRSCGATHWQTLTNIVIPLIRPGNKFVFSFIGLSDFIPVVIRNGKIFIEGGEDCGEVNGQIPSDYNPALKYDIACRPSEIDFVPEGVRAEVVRRTYLGDIVDYLLKIGDVRIRVQKPRRHTTAQVGEMCHVRFNRLLWYDRSEETASRT